MFYRKKPVLIEAFELGVEPFPEWFLDRVSTNEVTIGYGPTADIQTLEGVMHADVCDFIIKGVNGEIYPCKPDIFRKTYEKVALGDLLTVYEE